MSSPDAERGIYYEEFHAADGTPRLAECAILFVDLLGVKGLAGSPSAGEHLARLDLALRESRDFLRLDSPWPAAYSSDSLLLVAPTFGMDGESAVGGLLDQAAWLQTGFATHGFTMRGGLTIGQIHLSPNLLFGRGLIEAWKLEDSTAVDPRILLGPKAVDVMRRSFGRYRVASDAPQTWQLLIDQDGQVVIDYLTASIVDNILDPAEDGLEYHRDLIVKRLAEHEKHISVWSKFVWAAQYHNWVCDQLFSKTPELTIADVGARRFTRFVPTSLGQNS